MNITKYNIKYRKHRLLKDIILEENGYWALDVEKHLIHNDQVIAQVKEVSLEFPFFRKVGENFLVIEGEWMRGNNAWIINRQGKVLYHFFAGRSPYKVHTQAGKILIAQGEAGYNMYKKRLLIYDYKGNLLKVFNREGGQETKAIAKKSETEVVLFVYRGRHREGVAILNLETYKWEYYKLPEQFHPYVITYFNGFIYLLQEKETAKDLCRQGILQIPFAIYKGVLKADGHIEPEVIGEVDICLNSCNVLDNNDFILADYHQYFFYPEQFCEGEISYRVLRF